MPPLWTVDIQKSMQGEYWTNRYIVDRPDIDAAASAAAAILQLERKVHWDVVTFDKYRVSDQDSNTDLYIIVPAGVTGLWVSGGGDMLPLFNCFRVDFSVATGRPSRKYLRSPVAEGQATFNTVTELTRTQIQTEYVNPLVALTGYVDVDGQEILSGAVIPTVAMRQLRRGSKRRTLPVI